jgi:hypothetical protein
VHLTLNLSDIMMLHSRLLESFLVASDSDSLSIESTHNSLPNASLRDGYIDIGKKLQVINTRVNYF